MQSVYSTAPPDWANKLVINSTFSSLLLKSIRNIIEYEKYFSIKIIQRKIMSERRFRLKRNHFLLWHRCHCFVDWSDVFIKRFLRLLMESSNRCLTAGTTFSLRMKRQRVRTEHRYPPAADRNHQRNCNNLVILREITTCRGNASGQIDLSLFYRKTIRADRGRRFSS